MYTARILCLLAVGLSLGCCRQKAGELHVLHMANPEYPERAIVNNIQGRVDVQVQIGADGRVTFAKAVGAHPLLAEAAEKNVRTWEFGPFPPVARFPIYDIITYDFKLKGPPLSVIQMPTVVHTYLPNRVEIESRLFKDDLAEPISPAQSTNSPRHAR
jgi:TonB family protein